MYRHLAEDVVHSSIEVAFDHFGESERRRLYLAFMQAYAAGTIEANRLIRKYAPKTVTAAATSSELFPLEDDPFIALYTTESIMSLRDIDLADRSEIRWRLTHAISQGASTEAITNDLLKYFDNDRIRATRFARTATSDIYNRATLHRYEDSGVVDGVQYAAHIDNRTSEICRVLNRTIWRINDPGIRSPPNHFHCRSRLKPYFGKIPGARDYSKDFDQKTIDSAFETSNTFRKKYWNRFPRTRSSAVMQRHYLLNHDIDYIRNGLTKLIDSKTITGIEHDRLKNLKAWLRIRKVEKDTSIIIDAYGKSLLLDREQREAIRYGLMQLIKLKRADLARKEIWYHEIWEELPRIKRQELNDRAAEIIRYERTLDELPF